MIFSKLQAVRTKPNLRIDIIIILIVKVCLLWLLWFCCFSDPIEKDQRLNLVNKTIMNR